jgi:hypothetical protein
MSGSEAFGSRRCLIVSPTLLADREAVVDLPTELVVSNTNILNVFEHVKSVIGLSSANVVELGVYSASPRDDGVSAKVMGFTINVGGSNHRLYVVCTPSDEDWSKVKVVLPNLLNKVRWRNRDMFSLPLFASSIMVDNYLNEFGGHEYEEALKQITKLIEDFELYRFRCYNNELLKSKLDDLYKRSFFLQALDFAQALAIGSFYNFVLGNMPSCFAQLRLALESLAEALIIDYRYGFGDGEEYVEKCMDICMRRPDGKRRERCVEMCKELPLYRKYILWRRMRKRKQTTRVFMEQLATVIGEENAEKVTLLWNRLSSGWIHFTGYAEAISIIGVESYMFAVPVLVIEEDPILLRDSIAMTRAINTLRKLTCSMFNAWLVKVEEYDKDIAKCFTRCEVPKGAEYIETASLKA